MHHRRPYRLVQPLTGLWETRAAAVPYRALAPDGAGRSYGISATHSPACHSATHSVTRSHGLFLSCGGTSSDHCSLITALSSYTFSAKEKDSETGLTYFGARYYSSDLSIWLSVDPMSDKYPSLSPYTYCADNPVKLVDPNGEEWEVNESGYVRQVGDIDNNTLYAVKGTTEFSFGERKTNKDGTFISMMADEEIMRTMTSDGNNFTGYISVDNRDKMIETFNFMADNTNVEWAMIGDHVEVGTNIIQTDFLYTSHDNIQCDAFFGRVVSYGKNNKLDYHRHSHPKQYTGDNIRYALLYPITSHYTSSNDRKLRDDASPSNYVSV